MTKDLAAKVMAVWLPIAAIAANANAADLQTGPWRAWLDSPGGPLPFLMDVQNRGDGLRAWMFNGPERIAIPRVERRDDNVVFAIDHYDATLNGKISKNGSRIDGEWVKTTRDGKQSRLPFHAVSGAHPRFVRQSMSVRAPSSHDVTGRWRISFSSSADPAVGLFTMTDDGIVNGTIMTTTGDYRYLVGTMENRRLRLSVFDGAHAFLFDARLKDDGTLAGDFWSRDAWHETWTAERDTDVALPDAFLQTAATSQVNLGALMFPDVDGKVWSLNDERFAGKARIIVIVGSWCPNCHDASDYLVKLDRRYRDKGLSIVALSFELTGDAKRDARQVRRYVQRHDIKYPVLIAGTSDKKDAAKSLPMLKELKSYPTTIFLDSTGHVRAVHTGFTGPATGPAYDRLRERFERHIEALLQ
jgi:thiol-disulfide isomerase/thioredoxin